MPYITRGVFVIYGDENESGRGEEDGRKRGMDLLYATKDEVGKRKREESKVLSDCLFSHALRRQGRASLTSMSALIPGEDSRELYLRRVIKKLFDI